MINLNDFLLNLPLPLLDHWGYLIIFLSAITETLPILGTFVPGQTVVVLAGVFAKLNIFRLEAVIAVAIAGAVIGDLLAYFIGRKFGYDFVIRYGGYFFLKREKFEQAQILVAEHAGKALILGRFNPFTRAVAAFIAGICRVRFSKFIFYSIVGSVIWAVTSIALGYVVGEGIEAAAKHFGRIILAAVALIIAIVLLFRYLNKKKHIFARLHFIYLAFNVFAIYAFSKLAEDYLSRGFFYGFDIKLSGMISSAWRPWLDKVMVAATNALGPEVLLTALLLAAAYFLIKKNWYKSGLVFFGAAGLIMGELFKLLVNRPRPDGGLISESGLSFPSQHAFMAFIFFALAILLFAPKIKKYWLRYLFILGSAALILLVGFSRIYLKVHYFSDVLAGYALALFWLTFLILIFRIGLKLSKEYPNFFKIRK
ncbi:MAG: bifunctional DedA family/phosphatase PAP2 family protein [bacterium]|nr:bifunctional DedA family/phosphatase PAP2 family protein [bacterium]